MVGCRVYQRMGLHPGCALGLGNECQWLARHWEHPFADLFGFWEGSTSREKSEAIGDGEPGPVGRWGFSAESTNPHWLVDNRFVDFIAPYSVVHQGTECNFPMCQHFLCVPTRPGHSRIFFYG